MEKFIIDPQKFVWPFVYRIIARGDYELERIRSVNSWTINVVPYFGSIVVNENMVDLSLKSNYVNRFQMQAIHVKGGLVLQTTDDIINFLKS